MENQVNVNQDLCQMFEKVFNVSLTDDKQEMVTLEYQEFLSNGRFYYIMPRSAGKTVKAQRTNFYHMYRIMKGN